MGSIYRRGKVYWLKYHRGGKAYYESSRSDKLEKAKKLLKLREGEIAQGKIPGVSFDRVFFDELAEDLLTDYRINHKKSYGRAALSVKHLKVVFQGIRVPGITTARIKTYIDKRLQEGSSNASINRELAALKRMLHLGAEQTPPKVDRVPHIPTLEERNIRKGFFEYREYRQLLDSLPGYLKPAVTFAYMTGWRKEEILSLKWPQVDLAEGTVRLEPGLTKNDEGRTFYMDDELWSMMKDLHRNRRLGCPYVFHKDGKRIQQFRKTWESACKKAGARGMVFHDLRRTAVRNMIRAGIPERVAMTITGHKTRAVFDRYNIVSTEDLKEAAKKRQDFNVQQAEWLQNGYNRPIKEKRGMAFNAITP